MLVGWLLWQASTGGLFSSLRDNPPDPRWLALSAAGVLVMLVLASIRWWNVVAAAGITITLLEAVRLGALGFACSFVALGSVGGDVVKAAMLAKPRPGKRAAAVSTIFVDRLMGLLGFLTYAACAVLLTGHAWTEEPTPLRLLCQTTLVAAVLAIGAFVVALAPGRLVERASALVAGAPVVGPIGKQAAELAATYHDGRARLLSAIAVGLTMNATFILSFYAAAASLPLEVPSVVEHFFVVPMAAISGALPISPNGLGTIEATAEYTYRALRPDTPVGAGTMAALSLRLAMLAAGVVCVAFYYAAGGRAAADLAEAAESAASKSNTDEGSGTATPADEAATASRQTV